MLRADRIHSKGISLLLAGLVTVLAACATSPATNSTAPAAPAATNAGGSSFNTGRLTVYVVDQNGKSLDRTNIDVSAEGGYRASGVSDRDGRAQFNGVPLKVNVTASHQRGSFSQDFNVLPNGSTEMRMIIEIAEAPDPQSEEPVGGF